MPDENQGRPFVFVMQPPSSLALAIASAADYLLLLCSAAPGCSSPLLDRLIESANMVEGVSTGNTYDKSEMRSLGCKRECNGISRSKNFSG